MRLMNAPVLNLSPRLALCAELVREGRALADIGTDHAYLPIKLLLTGKTPCAVAADVNEGPLASAERNARRFGVGDRLKLLLSDGLCALSPSDADDIVIAGMGGELMLRMITETEWLKDAEKRLILQPMSSMGDLRLGLAAAGFEVMTEHAVTDAGKPYSAFTVSYTGKPSGTDELFPFMGKLEPGGEAVKAYAQKTLREIRNRISGAAHNRERELEENLFRAAKKIEERYL